MVGFGWIVPSCVALTQLQLRLDVADPPSTGCGVEAMQQLLFHSPLVAAYNCEGANTTRWNVTMLLTNRSDAILRYFQDMNEVLEDAMALLDLNVTGHSQPFLQDVECNWNDEYYNRVTMACVSMTECPAGQDHVWSTRRSMETPNWDDRKCALHASGLLLWSGVAMLAVCSLHCCATLVRKPPPPSRTMHRKQIAVADVQKRKVEPFDRFGGGFLVGRMGP